MSGQRVVIASGGTGGHIFPAQALIQSLPESAEVRWIGRENSMESAAAAAIDVPLWSVDVQGVRGKSALSAVIGMAKFGVGIVQVMLKLLRWRPNVVVGFGGYVSAAAGIAAAVTRVPLVLHEQNAVAGSTNRMLSKVASKLAQSFPDTFEKAVTTGNPVRAEFSPRHRQALAGRALQILVVGGSQGAQALNEALPNAIAEFTDIRVKHQCGRGHLTATEAGYQAAGFASVEVFEFDPDLNSYFDWADILIARAGASTIAELAASRLPAILVPLPTAIDDHQRANAQHVANMGGAVVIEQGPDLARDVAQRLNDMTNDKDKLPAMSKALDAFPMEKAREALASLVMEQVNGQ